jgi:hypothetical protein
MLLPMVPVAKKPQSDVPREAKERSILTVSGAAMVHHCDKVGVGVTIVIGSGPIDSGPANWGLARRRGETIRTG